MEALLKKYQHKFRKLREEMVRYGPVGRTSISLSLREFRDASSIIARLPIILDFSNYGSLKSVDGIREALVGVQMESLQTILVSMDKTLVLWCGLHLERLRNEGRQLVKGGSSSKLSTKQLQLQVGVKPCLADCEKGFQLLHEMYSSEYLLKSSIVSALSELSKKPSYSDLGALQELLVDQPNIPRDNDMLKRLLFRHSSQKIYIAEQQDAEDQKDLAQQFNFNEGMESG